MSRKTQKRTEETGGVPKRRHKIVGFGAFRELTDEEYEQNNVDRADAPVVRVNGTDQKPPYAFTCDGRKRYVLHFIQD